MATYSSTVVWRIRQDEKGTKEDEMVGWHHRLDRQEFEKLWELVIDREAWWATVRRVTKSWARLKKLNTQIFATLKHFII